MKINASTSPGVQPGIGVEVLNNVEMDPAHLAFLERSNLLDFGVKESWVVRGSNTQINYATHGVYRYFGKFPAPIAAKLIDEYSKPGELVIDPACGSGTTGVEALLSNREAALYDINPLSVLISRVKSRHIDNGKIENSLSRLKARYVKSSVEDFTSIEIDLAHWFLPETITGLSRLKAAISFEKDRELRDFLTMVFASIIRRVSRATTQQGRLFLDVTTAVEDVWPVFEKAFVKAATKISHLPKGGSILVEQKNLLESGEPNGDRAPLVVYHPPYFNAYKYTSINSLEMGWLDFPRKETRQGEIKEFFKVGKVENARRYVDDMVLTLQNIHHYVEVGGVVAMMIGDALMQGQHVDVTSQILTKVADSFHVEKTVVRIPKFTEATWASSQRRGKSDLGVTMCDFIIILRAK